MIYGESSHVNVVERDQNKHSGDVILHLVAADLAMLPLVSNVMPQAI